MTAPGLARPDRGAAAAGVVLARVIRDGVEESVHRGHVVLVGPDGRVRAVGDADLPTYVRSAVKPFQSLATTAFLADAGIALAPHELAIACSSHEGSATHQIEAAHLLALADLDESALRCPPALPTDLPALLDQRVPEALAHNCSGKHASFLYAQVASGGDPARYLDLEVPLQVRIRDVLAEVSGATPAGPGVDGCGAPAWVLPLAGLARAFAALAAGHAGLVTAGAAMRAHPFLVGGDGADDTSLMVADAGVTAKRGAEGVMAAGLSTPEGAWGLAVKVGDGAARGAGPVAAAVLGALGAHVPPAVREPMVLGGGARHGALTVAPEAVAALVEVR